MIHFPASVVCELIYTEKKTDVLIQDQEAEHIFS